MSDPSADSASPPSGPSALSAQHKSGRRSRLRILGWVCLVSGVVVIAASAWVGGRGWKAAGELQGVQQDLRDTRAALQSGDLTTARVSLAKARESAARAKSLTSDPIFAAAGRVPWLGQTPKAVATVASTIDTLANDPLTNLLAAGNKLEPSNLRPSGNQINVTAIEQASPYLDSAAEALQQAKTDIDNLQLSATPSQVRSSVESLQRQLDSLAATTSSAAKAASIAPAMLGADGPRTYFLAFQSPNEARGTGGLLGAFGIVHVDNGKVTIEKLASNAELARYTWKSLPINLGADYAKLYGDQSASWGNANLSPNYPDAAKLWRAMYAQAKGVKVDGVITVDPVVLSYVLGVKGSVKLPDGRVMTQANVVPFTQNEIYRWISNDNVRNEYLQQVSRAAFEKLLSGAGDTRGLLDALSKAVGERRVLIWSNTPSEQSVLASTSVGGVIPEGPQPFAGLAVINASGNKLDYYLQPSLNYEVASCQPDGARNAKITVRLANLASRSDKLPRYVDGRNDLPLLRSGLPQSRNGTYVDYAQVYATQGSVLTSATVDGKPVQVATGTEGGKPVYRVLVTLRPGQTTKLVVEVTEPPLAAGVAATPQTLVTPLVKPAAVVADTQTCPTAG